MKPWLLMAPLLLAGCASWPTGSYTALGSDADASVLAGPIVDQVAQSTEARQAVRLVPGPKDDPLRLAVQAGLAGQGIEITDQGTAHQVQYLACPLDQGELLRVVIDGTRGGDQFFTRDTAGNLTPGGPFMEFVP